MLDVGLLTFHAELGRYDWVASTALAGPSGSMGATGEDAGGGLTWLHPQALELTRHKPLAVFTNDIVEVFNKLRSVLFTVCAVLWCRIATNASLVP